MCSAETREKNCVFISFDVNLHNSNLYELFANVQCAPQLNRKGILMERERESASERIIEDFAES
jgi:hypothetical protein